MLVARRLGVDIHAADEAGRLLRDQRDQDRRNLEQLRELPDTHLDSPRLEETAESPSQRCFDITELAITGAPASQQAQVTAANNGVPLVQIAAASPITNTPITTSPPRG